MILTSQAGSSSAGRFVIKQHVTDPQTFSKSAHKLWGDVGNAQVYKGELDGKPVAIKFLHPATCPIDPRNTARFMAEVDLMRACRDRNVVDFIGAWVQQVSHLVNPAVKNAHMALMHAVLSGAVTAGLVSGVEHT